MSVFEKGNPTQGNEPHNELFDLKFALDVSTIVAITDERGIITYVNEKFCEVSKYTAKEVIGKTHRMINSGYHPKEFFKEMWERISLGKVWKGEIKNRAKDGTYYWVDTTIVPFLNNDGLPYQYMAIRHEITDKKMMQEQLKKMTTRIIDAQEDERKRLSRNLHDGIGQNLYSHLITIQRLQTEIDHPLIEQMKQEATQLIEGIREISWELRPSVIDDLGLVPSIRSYLNRFTEHCGVDIQFDCYLKTRLENNTELTIYRIIQESLTNIRKYAKTNMAIISIRELEDCVVVMIEDFGSGFDMKKTPRGVGVFSMKERARSIGGKLHIHSEPGKGTKIILEIPV